MIQLIAREWNGKTIRQSKNGEYFSGTDMCSACGKVFKDWCRTDSAQQYLNALSEKLGIPIRDTDSMGQKCPSAQPQGFQELIISIKGGDPQEQGTWIHRKVALRLAQWLSPEFAVQVDSWIEELLETGKVELQSHPEQELDSLAVLRQMLNTFEKQQKELKEQKAQLKQHNSKILECELDILETQNEVETLAQKINYYQNRPDLNNAMFTIDQYCRLNNLDPTRGGSISAGKKLTKICRLAEIEFNDNGVRKNEYPNWLLKALFDTVKDFHSNVVELLQKYLEYQINNE